MRLLLTLLAAFTALTLEAQKPFRGTITYYGIEKDSTDHNYMVLYFGDGAIRGRAFKKEAGGGNPVYENSDLLVLTREKKIYFLNNHVKEYEQVPLDRSPKDSFSFMLQEPPGEKIIGGLRCRAYVIKQGGITSDLVAWYAVDLVFEIPPDLMKMEVSPLLGNGKEIFMGLEQGLYKGGYRVNMVGIDSLPPPDSLFRLPADYTERRVSPDDYAPDSVSVENRLNADSAVRAVEIAARPAAPAKKIKKKSPPTRRQGAKTKVAAKREN